CSSRVDKV
ncbi:hypothetical protein D030_0217B, partial [Vibrio parahaemolyticus AQ3810]